MENRHYKIAFVFHLFFYACGVAQEVLWREDARCGPNFPAPNSDVPAQCNPNGGYPCCSTDGWCGHTQTHCNCDGCINYGILWREDERCGPNFPAPNSGIPAQCDPNGGNSCCNADGCCVNTSDHCTCDGCINYGILWRDDSRCGPNFFAPNSDVPAQCDPNGGYPCCSTDGWCGNTPLHCSCNGCISYRPDTCLFNIPLENTIGVPCLQRIGSICSQLEISFNKCFGTIYECCAKFSQEDAQRIRAQFNRSSE